MLINDVIEKYILVANISNIEFPKVNIDGSDLLNTSLSFILSSIFAFIIARYTLNKTNESNINQRKLTLKSTAIGLLNEINYNKMIAEQIISDSQITVENYNSMISHLSFELFTAFPSEILEFLESKDQIELLNIYYETKIQKLNISSVAELPDSILLITNYKKNLIDFEKILEDKYKLKRTPTSQ